MPLSVGDKLGHFEVLSLIGQGGMGEVYRARDTTLQRDVALKVLPATFLRDPERMARFQREAQVLASLDHPNIGHIYGIADSEDSRGLVLALIEGPTLADRIEAGPLPQDEAIAIAKQIIEALEYAHDRGVVHRDLKPANVKITSEGVVKVLDFGLAKVLEDEPSPSSKLGNSPTLTLGHTRAGVILGTAAYMSPEQAVGRPVDRRSDIFSFGAVLYEMLTGKRAFAGETTPDVLEAVVKNEPDWSKLPAHTPGAVRQLLRRCLVKDRRQRIQAIGEARIAIETMAQGPDEVLGLPTQVERLRYKRTPWAVAAGAVVIAAGLGVSLWRATQPPEPKPLMRLDVDLGPGVSLFSQTGPSVILSPDSSRLVYVAQQRLMTRQLDQAKATELPGTEGAIYPFFSPDGQWVAFFSQGKLNKISVGGGAVIPLADAVAPDTRGASWADDGSIIVALTSGGGLSRIPAAGGTPVSVTERTPGEVSHSWPQILPGGKAVLFSANTARLGWDGANIEVVSLAERHRKTLQRGATFGRYVPNPTSKSVGHLMFISRGTLFAVPFDLDKLEVRGTPVPVLDEVAYNPSNGSAQLDYSEAGSGILVYRSGVAVAAPTFQWLDNTGKTQPLLVKPGLYAQGRLSPDGQRLALTVTEGANTDVRVYDWQRDTMARLTYGGTHGYPLWTPDGRFVVFNSQQQVMFWTRADGSGQPQPLTQEGGLPFSFTPDGKRLAVMARASSGGRYKIWTVPIENNGTGLKAGKREAFLQTDFDEREPAFSPDGKWLAYASDESGTFQVYVRPFPERSSGAGGKSQVSNSGGLHPQWSRTAPELFFHTQETNTIMVAGYTVKGDSFVPDRPHVWSERRLADVGSVNYDLAPDGKRIAALMRTEEVASQQPPSHVTLLLNFSDELRRRVPAGK